MRFWPRGSKTWTTGTRPSMTATMKRTQLSPSWVRSRTRRTMPAGRPERRLGIWPGLNQLESFLDTAMMDRAARSLTVTCAKAPNAFDDGDDRPTLVHDRRLGIVHWTGCDVVRHRVAKHDQERGSRIGGMVTLTIRSS
jgi:hypothetical protein